MKILLICPVDREFLPPSVFPLGLGYIASILGKDGYDVRILDLNGARDPSLLDRELDSDRYDCIGISSMITQYKRVKGIVKTIRVHDPLVRILLGGSGPSSHPALYLNNTSADIVCIGEGERTILELLDILENSGDLKQCRGIAYQEDGNIIATEPRDLISDLDSLPSPAWGLFETTQKYIDNCLFKFHRKNGINIMTSRGCSGRCTYCFRNCGNRIRYRSPENVLEEIRFLRKNYSVEHFHFIDDTFLSKNVERISRLLSLLRRENMTWSCNDRVNYVNIDVLQEMKQAGCIHIAYGIESGSQKILNEMKKGVKVNQASNALKWTREAGIDCKGYFMIGMPGETEETINETVRFCKENLVGGEFFFATPFPSTPLYRYAVENNLINNEDLYNEIAGEVRDFVINLTQMENETLFTLKENAEKEIQAHLKAHGVDVKVGIRQDPRISAKNIPSFSQA